MTSDQVGSGSGDNLKEVLAKEFKKTVIRIIAKVLLFSWLFWLTAGMVSLSKTVESPQIDYKQVAESYSTGYQSGQQELAKFILKEIKDQKKYEIGGVTLIEQPKK